MPSPASRARAGRIRRLLAVALVAATACSGDPFGLPSPPSDGPEPTGSPSRPRREPPNIVLILTDDQRWDSLQDMPEVQRLLVDEGTVFTDAFTTDALCCPSRASILTGTYPHTHGVYRNSGRHGGWAAFHDGAESSTIATWLHDAGYRTGMFGKYFNGYRTTEIPPGWDRVLALTSPGPGYYDYEVNDDGAAVEHGSAADDYATDVFARGAVEFIRTTPRAQPLFLFLAPSAPHLPADVPPRHATAEVGQPIRSPAVNEADVSDKPAYIAGIEPLGQGTLDKLTERRARSLLAVDDAVADIVHALERTGRLERTLLVFASDNGLAVGEHRWRFKLTPYEESIRIPLVIRYDALSETPGAVSEMALNIDLAPTFAAAAGIEPASPVEGRSLLPLLRGSGRRWRRDFLIENLAFRRGNAEPEVPSYCAIRTSRWKYVRYETGETELYDLRSDPFELENLTSSGARPTIIARLDARLRVLCDPPPPGTSF